MLDGLESDDSDSPAIGLFPPGVSWEQVHDQIKIAHHSLLMPRPTAASSPTPTGRHRHAGAFRMHARHRRGGQVRAQGPGLGSRHAHGQPPRACTLPAAWPKGSGQARRPRHQGHHAVHPSSESRGWRDRREGTRSALLALLRNAGIPQLRSTEEFDLARHDRRSLRPTTVPRKISRPVMVALTWAGLIEWQTIKVPVVVQIGLRRLSRGLLAS